MKKALISIVILNWNGKKVTENCLNSLIPQLNSNFEVLVVDNDSKDESVNYLKKRFPKIKIIKNKKNLGYAGGNNRGVKKAKGDYILILNNDVILDKEFLEELWKNKDKTDILGVKNYFYDKKNVLWAIGSKVNKFTMKASLIGNKEKDIGQYDKKEINYTVGSAMLINKKVIDKIGFLDENYFMYFEETEWQTRAKNAGFKISWIPSAKLWHKVGFSTGGGRTPLSAYYLVRNRAYYIKKWGNYKIVAYSSWFLEVLGRFIYGLIKNKEYARMSWKGARDFLKRKKGEIILKF